MINSKELYPILCLSGVLALAGCGGKSGQAPAQKDAPTSDAVKAPAGLSAQDFEVSRAAVIAALDAKDGALGIFELSNQSQDGNAAKLDPAPATGKRIMTPLSALSRMPNLSISRGHVEAMLNNLLATSASKETDPAKKRAGIADAFSSGIEARKASILEMHDRFASLKSIDGMSGAILAMEVYRLSDMMTLLIDSDGIIESTVSQWVKDGKAAASVDLDTGTMAYESSGISCVKNFAQCADDIIKILDKAVTTGKGNEYATAAVFTVSFAKKLSGENIATAQAVSNAYLLALDISERMNTPSVTAQGTPCAIYLALDPATQSNALLWNTQYENCVNDINRGFAKMHAVTANAVIWTNSAVSKAVTRGSDGIAGILCPSCKAVNANNQTIVVRSKALDAKNAKAFDASMKKVMDLRSAYIKANPTSLLVVGGEQASLRADAAEAEAFVQTSTNVQE